ncbi:hypothetical protein JYT87_01815 [Nitrospira defluvii]|nr:hypothetical protein [Nitrospira defluvii]
MYEEPYRWVDAVSNRREYLDEQLKSGSPVVVIPCQEGILLLTLSSGTQKLYEIYDRIALGAIGHPADVERLRNVILDMAHTEGFNRSPSDVTARRLLQFGLAPMVKQAFEEITHAPFIIRLLIAELNPSNKPCVFSLNYDGVFKEESQGIVLAPDSESAERTREELKNMGDTHSRPMADCFQDAFKLWGLGETTKEKLDTHLKQSLQDRSIEAALLSSSLSGTSKYRLLTEKETTALTQAWRPD